MTVKSTVGQYTSKKGGRKRKKKFQHQQASVAIKPEKAAKKEPTVKAKTPPPPTHAGNTDKKGQEPYVAPRAPDDPGPDASDQDITGAAYKDYRTLPS